MSNREKEAGDVSNQAEFVPYRVRLRKYSQLISNLRHEVDSDIRGADQYNLGGLIEELQKIEETAHTMAAHVAEIQREAIEADWEESLDDIRAKFSEGSIIHIKWPLGIFGAEGNEITPDTLLGDYVVEGFELSLKGEHGPWILMKVIHPALTREAIKHNLSAVLKAFRPQDIFIGWMRNGKMSYVLNEIDIQKFIEYEEEQSEV